MCYYKEMYFKIFKNSFGGPSIIGGFSLFVQYGKPNSRKKGGMTVYFK